MDNTEDKENELSIQMNIKLNPIYDRCKQGKFCRGKCNGLRAKLNKRGGKKYDTCARCTCCSAWMKIEDIVKVGIYNRCPCCNMKVRTKRFTSLSTKEK